MGDTGMKGLDWALDKRGLSVGLAASLLFAACTSMDQTQADTAKGAGIGAVAGAVLGGIVGGRDGAATGAVLGGAAGAVGGNIWSTKMQQKQQSMEQATQGSGVQVARTEDNQLRLQVPSDISFAVGRADIQPALRSILEQFAQGLGGDPSMHVRIVGHTDSTGGDALNDRLSMERATSVRDYLIDRGVSGSRIETAGRGSHEPVADNATEAGRARNRRVEILLREPGGPS